MDRQRQVNVLAHSASLVVTSQCYILLFLSAEHLPTQFTCPLKVVIHHAALCTARPSDSPARFSPGTSPVPLSPSPELQTLRSCCRCALPASFPPAGLSQPPGVGVCRCSGGYCARQYLRRLVFISYASPGSAPSSSCWQSNFTWRVTVALAFSGLFQSASRRRPIICCCPPRCVQVILSN